MKTTLCTGRSTKTYSFFNAIRCGAKTRSSLPCKAPAMRFKKRCRMHGGSIGSGAPIGNQNAFKHGFSTIKSKSLQKQVNQLFKSCKKLLTL